MKRIHFSIVFIVLLFILLSLSCSSESSRQNDIDGSSLNDSARDKGDTDNEAEDAASLDAADIEPEPPCFDPDEVPTCRELLDLKEEDLLHRPTDVLLANQLGAGTRFTAIGGWAVLGETTEGEAKRWSIAMLDPMLPAPDNIQIRDIEWPDANGDYQVLDVWGGSFGDTTVEANVVALTCDSATCTILGANTASDSPLRPIPEMTLPKGSAVNAIVKGWNARTVSETVCVFGDVLLCYESDQWVTEFTPQDGIKIRDVTFGETSIAVGDNGALWIRGDSGWQLTEINTSNNLTHVASVYGRFIVIGEDGLLYDASDESSISCRPSSPLLAAIPREPFGQRVVIDVAGDVYEYTWLGKTQQLAWCKKSSVGSIDVLDFENAVCGVSDNLFLLASDRIISASGVMECAITN